MESSSSSAHYPAQSLVGATDASTSVATIRYVTQTSMSGEHKQLHQKILELFKQCGIPCHANVSHKEVYKNEQFLALLKEFRTLGHWAHFDQAQIKNLHSNEGKVIGLTGACLQDNTRQKEILEDITQHKEQVALMDDKLQKVQELLQSVQKQQQELKSWFSGLYQMFQDCDSLNGLLKSNEIQRGSLKAGVQRSLAEHTNQEQQRTIIEEKIRRKIKNCSCLEEFAGQLRKLMAAWRKVQALKHANLIALSTEYQEWMEKCLNDLFNEYFESQHRVDSQISGNTRMNDISGDTRMNDIRNSVFSMSWYWIRQPDLSILSGRKVDVSVRLFGLTARDVHSKTQVYIFPESDQGNRFVNNEYLCTDESQKPKVVGGCNLRGVTVTFTDILVDKKRLSNKRHKSACCEQLYRICLLVKSERGNWPDLQCLSLPFTIRTASNQLWEFIGMVTSQIFSVENLYHLPSQCSKELSIDQILTMSQAMLMAKDPGRKFYSDEIQALKKMLKELTSTDKIHITQLVKAPMPWHGRKEGKKNDFSFFNWFIAALNTYTELNNNFFRGISYLLSCQQCTSYVGRVDPGSCRVRISQNEVDGPGSETPTAKIVVHIYDSRTTMLSKLVSVQELTNYSLLTRLKRLKNTKEKVLVDRILPMNILLQDFKDLSDTVPQEKINGYITKSRDMIGDTILSQGVERLSINSDDNDEDHYSCENDPINDDVPSKIPRTVGPGPPSSVALWQGFGGGMSENINGQTGGGWMSENINMETGGGGMSENISGETGGGGMSENTPEDSWRNIEPTLCLDTDQNEDSLIDTYDPVQPNERCLNDLLHKYMSWDP